MIAKNSIALHLYNSCREPRNFHELNFCDHVVVGSSWSVRVRARRHKIPPRAQQSVQVPFGRSAEVFASKVYYEKRTCSATDFWNRSKDTAKLTYLLPESDTIRSFFAVSVERHTSCT